MAKTKKIFFVISILSLLALAGAGCGKGATTPGGGEQPRGAEESGGGGDLAGILGLGREIKNYSYEEVTVTGGETLTSLVAKKDQKMRREMTVADQTTVMYFDLGSGEIYTYMPSTKQAIKMSAVPDETENNEPLDETAGKIDPKTKILGRETVNGEATVVVEVTVENMKQKMWISVKYGLPMKIEAETPGGKITTEVRNLKVGGVTDADVTLPPEAKIVELPTFPGFGQ